MQHIIIIRVICRQRHCICFYLSFAWIGWHKVRFPLLTVVDKESADKIRSSELSSFHLNSTFYLSFVYSIESALV